jgi:hypothetical protein
MPSALQTGVRGACCVPVGQLVGQVHRGAPLLMEQTLSSGHLMLSHDSAERKEWNEMRCAGVGWRQIGRQNFCLLILN